MNDVYSDDLYQLLLVMQEKQGNIKEVLGV